LRTSLLAFYSCGVLSFLLSAHRAEGSDIVTVRVWADPAYLAQKAAHGSSDKTTYIAAQGEYFDSTYRDPSVSRASLGKILGFLAPTLTKQGYYPAKDVKSAAQLLVVHWGTTMGNMNEYVQAEANLADRRPLFHVHGIDFDVITPTLAAPTGLTMAPDHSDDAYAAAYATNVAQVTAQSMTTSSAEGLLGYAKQLSRERKKLLTSDVERTLEANMQEDRYFVILQAYDFQKLQNAGGRKLLWSAHMSVRAPGLNFSLALPRMGQVAADLYGQSNDEVVTGKFQPGKTGSVEIGPLTVLSEDTPPAQKK
jgi:hypothetical protein